MILRGSGFVFMILLIALQGCSSTSLVDIVTKGNVSETNRLLENGADLESKDYRDNTALMIAAREGHSDVLGVLLQRGANVDARNVSGETALMLASKNGHVQCVRSLLEYNADVNVRKCWSSRYQKSVTSKDGETRSYTVSGRFCVTALDLAKNTEIENLLKQAGGKSGK